MKKSEEYSIILTAISTFLYCLLVAGTMLIFIRESLHGTQIYILSEFSLIEKLQVVYLLACSVIFMLAARVSIPYRTLATLFTGMILIAVIREFDYFLDKFVFDGAWQLLALLTLVTTAFFVYRGRKSLKPSIQAFISKPCFGFMASSFISIVIFSRIIGMSLIWKALMGDSYLRVVKTSVEEGCELFGYALLFISAVEFLREVWKER